MCSGGDIGAAIGGTIGFLVGGPSGAAVGAQLGASAGNSADPQAQAPIAEAPPAPPKKTQSRKQADSEIAAARARGDRNRSYGSKRGTLLTGSTGVFDSQLNIGKTLLGQ